MSRITSQYCQRRSGLEDYRIDRKMKRCIHKVPPSHPSPLPAPPPPLPPNSTRSGHIPATGVYPEVSVQYTSPGLAVPHGLSQAVVLAVPLMVVPHIVYRVHYQRKHHCCPVTSHDTVTITLHTCASVTRFTDLAPDCRFDQFNKCS
ncbi:hypothetical protein J6590_003683 [Homalodisca vitripennis]|nr:hypothetical protein J6590_003683 [Homalodisca vitripennis]